MCRITFTCTYFNLNMAATCSYWFESKFVLFNFALNLNQDHIIEKLLSEAKSPNEGRSNFEFKKKCYVKFEIIYYSSFCCCMHLKRTSIELIILYIYLNMIFLCVCVLSLNNKKLTRIIINKLQMWNRIYITIFIII